MIDTLEQHSYNMKITILELLPDHFVLDDRYILIYPQGCDVCNHLSLFLCVANHDKLLPGSSYFKDTLLHL